MPKFKPRYNQNVNLTIKNLGIFGEGVGRWHGHTLFAEGALPGEVVRGRICDTSKRFGRVRVDNISELSNVRTEAPCEYFGKCGGCQLMHMQYSAQLEYKQARVKQDFLKFAGLDIEVEHCRHSPEALHYRNKILLPCRGTQGDIQIGLYARDSHELVQTEHCYVHNHLGERVFSELLKLVKESDIIPYCPNTHTGELRFILIKSSETTGQALVTFIVNEMRRSIVSEIADKLMSARPEVKGFVLNFNTEPGNTALGETFETIKGQPFIEEEILGNRFHVSPASFFQVNVKQAEDIYTKSKEVADLKLTDVIVDAYCGVGTLALSLSPYVKEVIGIECVPQAIEDAKRNADRNNIQNTQFVCGKSEECIQLFPHLDVAFLNPPRKGCEELFLEKLVNIRPKKIVYISCDPKTMARDFRYLIERGYSAEKVYPFDMFPQTTHVECVSSLTLNA